MYGPYSNRSKNESYWIFRILQRAEQIANMYACSSIIQFSWIIKLYFFIKSDWVSCCSWDFLASHQTCRQNCSTSASLSEIISCHLSVTVFVLYWAFSFWPSQLFGPECNKTMAPSKTGQVRLGPHHVHSPSRGVSYWFLFFWKTRKGKGCASAHTLCVFQRKKSQKSRTGFQLSDPGVSDRMYGLPDAVARWSAKSFCKDTPKCEIKGQWHLHTSSQSPLQMFFKAARLRAWWNCYGNRAYIIYLFIYLLSYAHIYLKPDIP